MFGREIAMQAHVMRDHLRSDTMRVVPGHEDAFESALEGDATELTLVEPAKVDVHPAVLG
jgi:hypothetical protein